MDYLAGAVVILMALFAATAMLSLFEQLRFYRRVRDRHYRLWLSLGGPDAFVPRMSAAIEFLMRRDYLAIDDASLHALGKRVLTLWAAGTCQLLLLFCLLLVMSAGS
jgi:hypothetical protein